jgi:hypothetical protein
MGVEWRAARKPNEAGKINTEICLKILDAAGDNLYVLGESGVISSLEGARGCTEAQRYKTLLTFVSRSVRTAVLPWRCERQKKCMVCRRQPSGIQRSVVY